VDKNIFIKSPSPPLLKGELKKLTIKSLLEKEGFREILKI